MNQSSSGLSRLLMLEMVKFLYSMADADCGCAFSHVWVVVHILSVFVVAVVAALRHVRA